MISSESVCMIAFFISISLVNTIETLIGIVPFVSKDRLSEMVETAGEIERTVAMEFLISIIPFPPKDMVRKLAEGILRTKFRILLVNHGIMILIIIRMKCN